MAETIKITTDLIIIHREGGDESYGRNGEAIQDPNSNELAWIPDTAPAALLRIGVMREYCGPIGAAPRAVVDVFAASAAIQGLSVDAPRTGLVIGLSTPDHKVYTR